jgi:hypothetical protein
LSLTTNGLYKELTKYSNIHLKQKIYDLFVYNN